ncbi:bacteriohemerythrin [Candidatus Woesearchaeota archaeon]|nr:bacteriohemerythrin [Candidatus Woesearchaeota archaeon]
MSFVEWDDSLSVGVAEIDAQHKKEVEMLDKLYENRDIALLKELAEHTKMHFDTEEKYFDKFGYENSEAHKAAHRAFLQRAGEVVKSVEEGNPLTDETMEFIKKWLVNHINLVDKRYTKCFNENGLT